MDAWWRPVDGLDVKLPAGTLETELGSFATGLGPVPRGNELSDSPKLTFNGLVRYEFSVFRTLRLATRIDTSYTDAMFKEGVNLPLLKADDYWLVNARIALRTANDAWELALWGKNLRDEHVVTHAFDNGIGNGGRIYQPPRTWGLTLSYARRRSNGSCGRAPMSPAAT